MNFEKLPASTITEAPGNFFKRMVFMHSMSIKKTVSQFLLAVATLLVVTVSTAFAQQPFSGRAIASGTGGSAFSNPLAPQFDQPVNNPFAGIFKKPAFLENFKMPKLNFQKPTIDLPTLGNLIPQAEPNKETFLGKMKAKTDAFFAKASAFEKLIPGRQKEPQTGGSPEWESVRKSMEEILARKGEQNPLRSASGSSDTIRR